MRALRWVILAGLTMAACGGTAAVETAAIDAGDAGNAADSGPIRYDSGPDFVDASDASRCLPAATGDAGESCEPIGTGQPDPGCTDTCRPFVYGYTCTDGPPSIDGGVILGSTAYTYCSNVAACVRDKGHDNLCAANAEDVDAGEVNAWTCAAKADDPNNSIAQPPGLCRGNAELPGLVVDCCVPQ